jgi:hypothetical protein
MTNSERISMEIERMNAERERQAQANVGQIIGQIVAQQGIVKAANAKIAELRVQLAGVSVEPVIASDVIA